MNEWNDMKTWNGKRALLCHAHRGPVMGERASSGVVHLDTDPKSVPGQEILGWLAVPVADPVAKKPTSVLIKSLETRYENEFNPLTGSPEWAELKARLLKPDIKVELGATVRRLRKASGLTQEKFAIKIGLQTHVVTAFESLKPSTKRDKDQTAMRDALLRAFSAEEVGV